MSTDPPMPPASLLVRVDPDGWGRIELNRPGVINALNATMVTQLTEVLHQWRDDDRVTAIELAGAGERGLCSGADVVALRSQLLDPNGAGPGAVRDFLLAEYALDAQVAHYPKPITAVLDGITMGGGLGLALHATTRVGTPSTRLAMPETIIGLFPDVGSLFHLTRMPGRTGLHLALTGTTIDAASGYWAGLLDEVDELAVHPDDSALARARSWIDQAYCHEDAVSVMRALTEHPNPEAQQSAAMIAQRCPLSVQVTFEAYQRATLMDTVDQVLAQDAVLASHFVTEPDFAEGVRAQLVDKDRQPRWRHRDLASVPAAEVMAMFEPSDV